MDRFLLALIFLRRAKRKLVYDVDLIILAASGGRPPLALIFLQRAKRKLVYDVDLMTLALRGAVLVYSLDGQRKPAVSR